MFFLSHLLSYNVTELTPSMSLAIHNNSTYHSALPQTRISLLSLKIPIGFYNKPVKSFSCVVIHISLKQPTAVFLNLCETAAR